MSQVYITGVGMTPFAKAPVSSVSTLASHAVAEALRDAGLSAAEVDIVFFGNAMNGLMEGQEMIRAQAALAGTGLLGAPMMTVENACASSSSAAFMAHMAVASGQAEVAIAIGSEKLTHEDRTRAFDGLATAVNLEAMERLEREFYGEDDRPPGERSFFMDVYADMAKRYMDRTDVTAADFADVVVKSRSNASLNPRAQFRNAVTREEVLASRVIADPLTLPMCSPTGDGAAAIVFTSAGRAAQSKNRKVRVAASSLVSGNEGPSAKTAVERAAAIAYERAGIGPQDLSVVEVHDAAAPAELMMYEELGLCAAGDAPKLLASGDTALGGRIPVNTSGGLISKGHPVGATGCAQLVELTEQLRGTAGKRQVDNARFGLAENAGGYLHPDPAAAVVTILAAV